MFITFCVQRCRYQLAEIEKYSAPGAISRFSITFLKLFFIYFFLFFFYKNGQDRIIDESRADAME